MSFRLSNEAKIYFAKIDKESTTGKFESMWDYYYLCLMAGFKSERMGEESTIEEFNKGFNSSYDPYKYLIIAALVSSEIRRLGILLSDSESIKKLMLELLNQDSPTRLSKTGLDTLNRYADGGFKLLNEKIPQPIEMDEFIMEYYENFMRD